MSERLCWLQKSWKNVIITGQSVRYPASSFHCGPFPGERWHLDFRTDFQTSKWNCEDLCWSVSWKAKSLDTFGKVEYGVFGRSLTRESARECEPFQMIFQNNPNQIGSYDFVLLPSPCSNEFSHIRGAPSDAFWGMRWASGWNGWPPRRKGKKRINSGGFGWVSWMMTRLLLWIVLWMLLHLGKMKCICIKYIYIDEIWMVIFPSCSWSQTLMIFVMQEPAPLLFDGMNSPSLVWW